MVDIERERIEQFKNKKSFTILMWFLLKLILASVVIFYFEYGIFLIVGYLLYVIESKSWHEYLNIQETNYHINKLYNQEPTNINELKSEIKDLKSSLADLQLQLVEMEVKLEDSDLY